MVCDKFFLYFTLINQILFEILIKQLLIKVSAPLTITNPMFNLFRKSDKQIKLLIFVLITFCCLKKSLVNKSYVFLGSKKDVLN